MVAPSPLRLRRWSAPARAPSLLEDALVRRALPAAALLSVVTVIAACSAPAPGSTSAPGPTTASEATSGPDATVAEVTVEQAAENLMIALRDGHTTAAWDIVSTGQADEKFNGIADFTAKMIAAGTPASWSFEPLKYGNGDSGSFVVVEGPVTFEDGDTGRVHIQMQALGMQANPWRVDEFRLTDE